MVEDYKIVLLNGKELVPNENQHFYYWNKSNKGIGSIGRLMSTVLVDFERQIREEQVFDCFEDILYVGITKEYGRNDCKEIYPYSAIERFELI